MLFGGRSIDEAQEVLSSVFNELRILSSTDLDARSLLCVIFAGDERLPGRFRTPELLPLGSRIRRRIRLDYADREQLTSCLDHLIAEAGNSALMTTELKTTLAEHAAGNFRVLMNMADEMLGIGAERDLPQLDERLFFEVFQPPAPKKRGRQKKNTVTA